MKSILMARWASGIAFSLILLLSAFIGLNQQPLQASASQLFATQDALLDPNNSNTTYANQRLEVAFSNFPGFSPTRRALLQFSLGGVSESLSASQLTVELVENNLPVGSQLTLALYTVNDTWNETTVTWENRPLEGSKLQTVTIAAGATGSVTFGATPVASFLESQRNGDHVASLLLVLEGGTSITGFGGNLLFESREGTADGINGNEPYLSLPNVMPPRATATTTPSRTLTPTPIRTTTPTRTTTSTSTATAISTATHTPMPNTHTPTAIADMTATSTSTARTSPAPTLTPTVTPTATITGSVTPIPTAPATQSATATSLPATATTQPTSSSTPTINTVTPTASATVSTPSPVTPTPDLAKPLFLPLISIG